MSKMAYTSSRWWPQLHPHHLTNINWGKINFLGGKSGYIFGKGCWEGNTQGSLQQRSRDWIMWHQSSYSLKLVYLAPGSVTEGRSHFSLGYLNHCAGIFRAFGSAYMYKYWFQISLFSKTLPLLPRAYCLFFSVKPSFSSLGHMSAAQM